MKKTQQTDTKKPKALTPTPWAVLTFKEEEIKIVSRFKTMYDATCYASILRQTNPHSKFEVRFLSTTIYAD
ncbi:hypothetical protein NIES4075_25170 [Tolypothrix sp. NIES-4075]|uniref:hypothetical protein n=1 Tax=Tolypothrix sp. NIES-4075 TaxID=2005459 RepID=UPI000B5C8A9F|nr:hypothetical protein [Tolypothrix sp. NIES-4075]GAX41544.1 hypothetical protein NIES4075_25170 [Tolypothrix sp. NIES-4075]